MDGWIDRQIGLWIDTYEQKNNLGLNNYVKRSLVNDKTIVTVFFV